MEISNPQFLMGFIAGEGSFSFATHIRPNTSKYNIYIQPRFSILVHEQKIIKQLHKDAGLGKQYDSKETSTWSIRRNDECLEFAKFVEDVAGDYFRKTNKYKQFSRWYDGVKLMQKTGKTESDMKTLVDISYEVGMPEKRNKTKEELYELIEQGGGHLCGGENKDGSKCKRNVAKPSNNCQHHK